MSPIAISPASYNHCDVILIMTSFWLWRHWRHAHRYGRTYERTNERTDTLPRLIELEIPVALGNICNAVIGPLNMQDANMKDQR